MLSAIRSSSRCSCSKRSSSPLFSSTDSADVVDSALGDCDDVEDAPEDEGAEAAEDVVLLISSTMSLISPSENALLSITGVGFK